MSPLTPVSNLTPASQVSSAGSDSLETLYPEEFIKAVGGNLGKVREFEERFSQYTLRSLFQLLKNEKVEALFKEAAEAKTPFIARGLDKDNRPYLLVAFPNQQYVLFHTNTNTPRSKSNQMDQWQQDHGSVEVNRGSPVDWCKDQCMAILEEASSGMDCYNRLSYLSTAHLYARDDTPCEI